MTNRTPFRWTFETTDGKLAACPICGETEIDREDRYRDSLPVTRSRSTRIWFKCGHVFNGEWAETDDLAAGQLLEFEDTRKGRRTMLLNLMRDMANLKHRLEMTERTVLKLETDNRQLKKRIKDLESSVWLADKRMINLEYQSDSLKKTTNTLENQHREFWGIGQKEIEEGEQKLVNREINNEFDRHQRIRTENLRGKR